MSRPASTAPGLAIAAIVLAAVLFGTSGTARELGPDSASSLSVGAARITIGSLVLWAVVIANRRREPLPSSASVRPLRWLLAIGGFGVAVYTPLFFVAVDRAGVAIGTLVAIASGPFFAAGLDWVFRRVRPTAAWLRGTVVTVVGAAVLIVSVDSAKGPVEPGVDLVGVAAALAAGFGYATYSVSSKATMERGLASTIALAIPFTIGVAVVLALSVGEPAGWLGTWAGLAMALYLGVVATGLAYVLFGYGLRRLTSAIAVTLVLAEPLTAALLAVVVLDESIPVAGWLGVTAVMSGLVLVGRGASAAGRQLGQASG